jgi:integrase
LDIPRSVASRNSKLGKELSKDTVVNNIANLIKESRAVSTARRYESGWKSFHDYCDWTGYQELPAEVVTVLEFLSWWELTGGGGSIDSLAAAIAAKHVDNGLKNPVEDVRVMRLREGVRRRVAMKKDNEGEREPLPISALRFWIENRPKNTKWLIWLRDAALVALALRCMRRPGEMGILKRKHILGWKDGLFKVKIPKSKTDQLMKGKVIPIDSVPDSKICPVKLVERYILLTNPGINDFLFQSSSGKQLSASAVSAIVKRMAENAQLKGKFSGHSLRIGGATAAAKAGLTTAQIKSVGGWSSDAVNRYIRPVSVAGVGASKAMGF